MGREINWERRQTATRDPRDLETSFFATFREGMLIACCYSRIMKFAKASAFHVENIYFDSHAMCNFTFVPIAVYETTNES